MCAFALPHPRLIFPYPAHFLPLPSGPHQPIHPHMKTRKWPRCVKTGLTFLFTVLFTFIYLFIFVYLKFLSAIKSKYNYRSFLPNFLFFFFFWRVFSSLSASNHFSAPYVCGGGCVLIILSYVLLKWGIRKNGDVAGNRPLPRKKKKKLKRKGNMENTILWKRYLLVWTYWPFTIFSDHPTLPLKPLFLYELGSRAVVIIKQEFMPISTNIHEN